MENIYLIGFMGTGKSTVAKELSKLLPLQIVEMDEAISKLEGMSINDIFTKKGENAFRDMETMFLKIISKESNQIISCGGGAVLRDENKNILKNSGIVVLLEATPETIFKRVYADESRPLLNGKKSVEEINSLLNSRKDDYENSCDFSISVDDKTPAEIANEIITTIALNGRLH